MEQSCYPLSLLKRVLVNGIVRHHAHGWTDKVCVGENLDSFLFSMVLDGGDVEEMGWDGGETS